MLGLGLRSLRPTAFPTFFACGSRHPVLSRSFIQLAAQQARRVPSRQPSDVLRLVKPFNFTVRYASELSNVPPVHSVRQITQAEAEADADPNNVGAQVKLFRMLLESARPAGRNVIISRWERMCEFVSDWHEYLLASLAEAYVEPHVTSPSSRRSLPVLFNGFIRFWS